MVEENKNSEETQAPAEAAVAQPVAEAAPEAPKDEKPIEHTLKGLLGRKLGMTQIFDKEGNLIPVTVVEAGPCTILELKDAAKKITLGYEPIKETRTNKARLGFFKKLGVAPMRTFKEFGSSDNAVYKVGMQVKADVFRAGDFVDVTGVSIGKGFQGGMRRHGWMGGPAGHGSMHHRRVGSIGASSDPSKVVKGHPMPGHMGNRQITTQSLRVMAVDVDENLIMLKGSVPGSENALVAISKSFKKKFKSLDEKKEVIEHKVNPMKQSKAKAGVAKAKGKK